MSRLHLVDGTYELFRHHYSKRPSHTTPDGQDAKGTVGVVASLLYLLESTPDEAVSHMGVAFDNPIRSFRNDLFAGYKSDAGVAPELLAQFDLVEEGVRALGVAVWSMDRWEADDALAAAAARWLDELDQVRICTPDKDLGQCVIADRVVLVDRMRQKVSDEPAVVVARGVPPKAVPDFLALMGDAADGIPGIPGIGAKTAATLLARYGSIEAIPLDAAEWDVKVRGAAKIASTLADRRDDALLYRTLATLATDVPLPQKSLADLAWHGVPRQGWETFCDRIGAGSLRDRPQRWADPDPSS